MATLTETEKQEIILTRRPPLSLYEWVKQHPKKHTIALSQNVYPKVLSSKASRLLSWFKSYPGDGVLFFHDPLLNSSVSFSALEQSYKRPDEYIKLFRYLYSFENNFTSLSKSVLAIYLYKFPIISIPLYIYRKQFDSQQFTSLISSMNKYKSIHSYTIGTPSKYITQFLWQTILGHQVPASLSDNSIFLHLYYGYTYQAIQRFFNLSNTKAAVKQHIIIAYNSYRQTYLLLNTWRDDPSILIYQKNRPIPQMSSIKAMQRFHDLKTEEIIQEQRTRETNRYVWDELSEIIQKTCPEWYIPERVTDIRMRGLVHRNCVGAYASRHFQAIRVIAGNKKTMLLFTDFYEAEVTIAFAEMTDFEGKKYVGCYSAKLQQATKEYNKEIPADDISDLLKIVKEFHKLPAEYFNPKKIPLKE